MSETNNIPPEVNEENFREAWQGQETAKRLIRLTWYFAHTKGANNQSSRLMERAVQALEEEAKRLKAAGK